MTAANQTDRIILVITTDNLQHFAKDQTCTQLVAQKGGLDMTLKILTTQDFDTELIQKSLDLLNNMLESPETITAALEADTLSILNNLISTQRKSPQVLTTVLLKAFLSLIPFTRSSKSLKNCQLIMIQH